MHRPTRFVSPFAMATLVFFGFACSGGGCSALEDCGIRPIPEAFPNAQRITNSGQIRLSSSGIDFIESNIQSIAEIATAPDGLTFAIPNDRIDAPAGITATPCPNGGCFAHATIRSLTLTPTPPNRLLINAQLHVDSRNATGGRAPIPIRVETFLGDSTPNIDLDTARGARQTVGLVGEVVFSSVSQPARAGYTQIEIARLAIADGQSIEDADIEISGGGVLGWLLGSFRGTLVDQLRDQIGGILDGALDDQLCQRAGTAGCPRGTVASGSGADAICRYTAGGECVPSLLGIDGRGDVGGFLGSFSPGTHAPIQFLLAAGGDGEAVTDGMTLNMLGGFMSMDRTFMTSPGHNPCVPILSQPALPTIAPAAAFRGNLIPTTQTPFHLGIGIAEDYLDYAGYGMFDSGMLCIGVGNRTVSQLSTGLFSILVPSLGSLSFPNDAAPISIALRPQQPPDFTIGTAENEPLLTLTMPQVQIDFYVFTQDRYVRFMTYQADLAVGINLAVTGGQLVPSIASITPSNSSVLNSSIIVENPTVLATAVESVVTAAAGMLGDSLSPIDLPAVMGFQLNVPREGIRGVNESGERYLGIFANLSLATTTSMDARLPLRTDVSISDLTLHPEVMTAENFGNGEMNSLWLHFDAQAPAGADLEFSYRMNGGPWTAWTRDRRVLVENRQLWLQARHEFEARSRIVGESLVSPTGSTVALIDITPPRAQLEPTEEGFRVHASDVVSRDALHYRFRVGQAPWTDWSISNIVLVPVDIAPELSGDVTVEVRDEAGNVSVVTQPLIRGIPNPANTSGCGCRAAGSRTSDAGLYLSGLFVLGVMLRRRARRVASSKLASTIVAALAASALFLAGCECGENVRPGPRDGGTQMTTGCGGATCSATQVCCSAQMMCVNYDLASLCTGGQTCMASAVTTDSNCRPTCSMCMDPPTLSEGVLATDLDLVVTGTDAFVSGYAPGVSPPPGRGSLYGDLVFGRASGEQIEWEFVDGVPSGPVTNDPDGFRDGISAPGDDVGRYTSMVRSASGTFYIAYYDVTHKALKIAIGTPGAFTNHVVDDTADSGRYASLVLTASGAPAVAYLRVAPGTGGFQRSSVVVATASSAMPTATSSWTAVEVSGGASPCRQGMCATGEVCLEDGRCGATGSGTPRAADALDDHYPGRGLFNQLVATSSGLALVFYDRSEGNLYGASFDGSAWGAPFLIDGYARSADAGDAGQGASLFIDSAGTWHVTYVDGADEALRYATVVDGAVTARELIDDGSTDGTNRYTDGRHIVGDDSSVVVVGTEVRVAYQDATSHRLLLARRTGAGTWTVSTLDSMNHTGFWAEQVLDGAGSRVVTWWRETTRSGLENGVRVIAVR